jgi:hypothetical protein
MDTELKAYLEAMDRRIGDRIDALDAKIERVETSLLTEFHKWASPNEARMRTHTATLRALDLEMEALSERVDKLEGTLPARPLPDAARLRLG